MSKVFKIGIANSNNKKINEVSSIDVLADNLGRGEQREVSMQCHKIDFPGRTLDSTPDTNIYGPTREIVQGYSFAEINATFQMSSDLKEKRLKALKGMVPSLVEMGDGCKLCSRFNPEDCACGGTGEEPKLYEYSPNHFVRCNPEIFK